MFGRNQARKKMILGTKKTSLPTVDFKYLYASSTFKKIAPLFDMREYLEL